MMHYVYYLRDAVTDELLYIGRSNKPQNRKASFIRRTGMSVVFGIPQRFTDFDKACDAELKAIKRHQPPYNVKLISSNGRLGHQCSPEYREKLSIALKGRIGTMTGKQHSAETKNKISNSNLGRIGTRIGAKLTEAHKEILRKSATGRPSWAKGKPQKPEHTEKIRQAKIKRDQEKRQHATSLFNHK